MQEEKEEAKQKRPTAKKREIQSEKRRGINKSFKSEVRTVTNAFENAIKAKDGQTIKITLSEVFSIMDKGVKRGVFKINKARRTKSRAQAKVIASSK